MDSKSLHSPENWMENWIKVLKGEDIECHADFIRKVLGREKPDIVGAWNNDLILDRILDDLVLH